MSTVSSSDVKSSSVDVKSSIDRALEDLAKIKLSESTKASVGSSDPAFDEAVQDPGWQSFVNSVKVNGYDYLLHYEEELMLEDGVSDPKGFMKLLLKLHVSDDEQVRLMSLYNKKAQKLLGLGLIEEGEIPDEESS